MRAVRPAELELVPSRNILTALEAASAARPAWPVFWAVRDRTVETGSPRLGLTRGNASAAERTVPSYTEPSSSMTWNRSPFGCKTKLFRTALRGGEFRLRRPILGGLALHVPLAKLVGIVARDILNRCQPLYPLWKPLGPCAQPPQSPPPWSPRRHYGPWAGKFEARTACGATAASGSTDRSLAPSTATPAAASGTGAGLEVSAKEALAGSCGGTPKAGLAGAEEGAKPSATGPNAGGSAVRATIAWGVTETLATVLPAGTAAARASAGRGNRREVGRNMLSAWGRQFVRDLGGFVRAGQTWHLFIRLSIHLALFHCLLYDRCHLLGGRFRVLLAPDGQEHRECRKGGGSQPEKGQNQRHHRSAAPSSSTSRRLENRSTWSRRTWRVCGGSVNGSPACLRRSSA